MLIEKQILLGSKSPRRRELLSKICKNIRYVDKEADESYLSSLSHLEVAPYLAEKKGRSLFPFLKENEILITADTLVILKNKILGKPKNIIQAKEYLLELSNNKHEVHTACFISNKNKSKLFTVTTEVYFNTLTKEDIDYYVENYIPLDKAGAYGIQEWIGHVGVKKINGCYNNVMGLPLSKVCQELLNF
ncbi:MAG: septum formation protein Maf [Flavobacteriia bacterium]|nr:septum formation protein Maf [Flavobacteriia bacterium]